MVSYMHHIIFLCLKIKNKLLIMRELGDRPQKVEDFYLPKIKSLKTF